ncbi:MAG TPA: nucleotidyltransferase family protein [Anaerolineae bacterium]
MDMTVQNKADILASLEDHKREIKALGVKRLGLFGSFVRSEQSADSDIDILVEFDQGQKTFDNFMQLAFFLESLLQRRVELVTPESISPYIQPYIIKEVEYVPFVA